MEQRLTIEDIRRAWEVKDPDLPDLVVALALLPDPRLPEPVRQGAPTFRGYVSTLKSRAFSKRPSKEQEHERIAGMKALEAPDAEAPLPDRLRLHELLMELWNGGAGYERDALLRIIAGVPLRWGPWRALKRIFKEAEERGDSEMFGALAARFDREIASRRLSHEVSRKTLGYLVRRAWRNLRRQAESLPACYADSVVDVLRFYPEGTDWTRTWIANHVFFHETKKYKRRNFRVDRRHSNLLTHRAYPELWRRTPRPLFTLLERAQSDRARAFAASALKTDFVATLREVEPSWVARLISVRSATVDEFVIWVLANVPRFEQGAFRDLGLHQPVLTLLDSPCQDARVYAASYARTHARDLSLDEVIRLANNGNDQVRKLARDLLHDRDPRKDVGLDGWGRLLGTEHGHALSIAALRKHFGARELTSGWFQDRLLSDNSKVFEFAVEVLPTVHTYKALGPKYFRELIDDRRLHNKAAKFALDGLGRFPLLDGGTADTEGVAFIQRALLHPLCTRTVSSWLEEERVKPKELGDGYLKTLAFHGTWDSSDWVKELKASGRVWARDLAFNESLSELALRLLSDVRKFSPSDLGFDWLMQLAARSEPRYTEFASEYMIKAFLPADFAGKAEAEPEKPATPAAPIQVDLKGQSFLFTGKLATMTRGQATKKVTAANGKNASGVNAKLDYLIIGDEGSPLYGAGRKGSKQLKAEKLIGDGAPMKIISETAFLQMLAGEERTFSEDTVTEGCDRLWQMATEPGPADAPLRQFALRYMRRHHPDISLALTDRPVDPGAEIPAEYLSLERVKPLFSDKREALRSFALDLARWEMARWKPPIEAVVELSESQFAPVRAFIEKALVADESAEHARYRIDPSTLTTDAVYSFCESLDARARALGMQLISRNPSLAVPEELFRLAESPDRNVQSMVIRTLWTLFRDKGTTPGWKPPPPVEVALAKSKKPSDKADPPPEVPTVRPENRPAKDEALVAFFRRILFSLPPARPPLPSEQEPKKKKRVRVRPIPARKAKLGLIEVMRDLAVEDAKFATVVTPLFEEFMRSRGDSERAACLVALTRIRRTHTPKDAA